MPELAVTGHEHPGVHTHTHTRSCGHSGINVHSEAPQEEGAALGGEQGLVARDPRSGWFPLQMAQRAAGSSVGSRPRPKTSCLRAAGSPL